MNFPKQCLILLVFFLLGAYAMAALAAPNPASKDYVNSTLIGRAAQGGIVFFTYLSGGTVHGLVAATADEPDSYTQADAIARCASKSEGGYEDWFLPGKAQITALFNNRFSINPLDDNGGFALSIYWSSSAVSSINGWTQNFSLGPQGAISVGTLSKARCIRTF